MLEPSAPLTRPSPCFDVHWVFGSITESLRQQIVDFWLQEGALTNPYEAWRRSWEVAGVLQETASGSIAGVCTVAIRMDDYEISYGFVRIFIRPSNRFASLTIRLMKNMIHGFEALAREPGAPRRLILTIENRKLERRASQKIIAKLGFVHAGKAANGELVMYRDLLTT